MASRQIGVAVALQFQRDGMFEPFEIERSPDDSGQSIVDFAAHDVRADSPSHTISSSGLMLLSRSLPGRGRAVSPGEACVGFFREAVSFLGRDALLLTALGAKRKAFQILDFRF